MPLTRLTKTNRFYPVYPVIGHTYRTFFSGKHGQWRSPCAAVRSYAWKKSMEVTTRQLSLRCLSQENIYSNVKFSACTYLLRNDYFQSDAKWLHSASPDGSLTSISCCSHRITFVELNVNSYRTSSVQLDFGIIMVKFPVWITLSNTTC